MKEEFDDLIGTCILLYLYKKRAFNTDRAVIVNSFFKRILDGLFGLISVHEGKYYLDVAGTNLVLMMLEG